jgi:hypothetical protein
MDTKHPTEAELVFLGLAYEMFEALFAEVMSGGPPGSGRYVLLLI